MAGAASGGGSAVRVSSQPVGPVLLVVSIQGVARFYIYYLPRVLSSRALGLRFWFFRIVSILDRIPIRSYPGMLHLWLIKHSSVRAFCTVGGRPERL